jgi:hypothetical protein
MNFKKSALASAITLATFATGAAAFDASSWEVSGFVKNETAFLQKDGTFNGQSTGPTDTTQYNDQGDVIKFENTLKLFVNGALGENADLHAELNFVADPEAKGSHFETHDDYSQTDYLRELYIDSVFGENSDIELRIGKQQVVWGTADGAKLLDIINPTDYREMAQNTMEDSRVPVWMAKLEMPAGENGTVQFVAAQPRENIFAGLNRHIDTSVRTNSNVMSARTNQTTAPGHDQGNPFILLGVDSITGKENGFLNIVPDLGSVAAGFAYTFAADLGAAMASAQGDAITLLGFNSMTVDTFAGLGSSSIVTGSYGATVGCMGGGDATNTINCTIYGGSGTSGGANQGNGAGMDGASILAAFAAAYPDTNLVNATSNTDWTNGVDDSTFEFMGEATFATFDAFVNAKSQYVYDMPDDLDLDLAARYKNSLDNGLNYSVNYAYAYDKNPIINLSLRNSSGDLLYQRIVNEGTDNTIQLYSGPGGTGTRYGGYASANSSSNGGDGDGIYSAGATEDTGLYGTLRFTQTVKRAHNVGTAFDYTLDTESLGGVVLRGEFLYQKDVYQPVMDLGRLAIGDLVSGLVMEKTDRFKYVIGADITVLTNMLVSAQFIQDRNLDYVDTNSTLTGSTKKRFTADYATMHMSNGFNKAEKNKEFYSLFLSKPFGPNQLGRFNNITMYEEGDGWWNRFDVEYSFTDEMIGTFELNNYWGDKNTQFGQLEDASNVQVGFKYLF